MSCGEIKKRIEIAGDTDEMIVVWNINEEYCEEKDC